MKLRVPIKAERTFEDDYGFTRVPNEAAKICLNCPLPKCVKDPLHCKHYKAEREKVKRAGVKIKKARVVLRGDKCGNG